MTANFRSGLLEQGMPLGMTYNQVLLTADNQNVDPTYPVPVSMLQIGSDNTTATNRTFTLTPNPQVGAQLLLYFYTGSSTTAQLADSGTMKLVTTWTPVQYDVLSLVSDGTNWNELCRGNSSGAIPSLALTDAHIFVGSALNVATDVEVTGDVTITNAGVTAIGSGVIVNADVSGSAAIAYSKLATLTSGNILVGSAGNVATSVTMSGDATIIASGALTLATSAVSLTKAAPALQKEATVTITQAQLLAIGTPVPLVAAQGAGTVIIVDEVEILHTYSTAVYATGADLQIEYETAGTNVFLVDSALVTAAASKSVVMTPTVYDLDGSTGTSEGFDVTALANKAIQLTGSNFTLGDVANILKITTRYHVRTLLT